MSSLLDFEIPGYDILEAIGRGGMASVYRARQHSFDRNVALKILKPDLSEDDAFCQRFMMESLIVAKLNHSHIVQVYDVGEISNHYYIAMEFLSGGDLNSMLKKGISVEDSVSVIKQIASALGFAHRKNIVHRDLKPDNVMFREDGAAVLTDFGIAKETDADINLTQTGLIVGTPKYMSPEQIKGSEPSPAGDIYSLGIMFYQLLTKEVPFTGPDLVAIAYKHFHEDVPKLPSQLAHFQAIVEAMLAKKSEERIATGEEIVKELERIEKNQESAQPRDEETLLAPRLNIPHNQETLLNPKHQETEVNPEHLTTDNDSEGETVVSTLSGSHPAVDQNDVHEEETIVSTLSGSHPAIDPSDVNKENSTSAPTSNIKDNTQPNKRNIIFAIAGIAGVFLIFIGFNTFKASPAKEETLNNTPVISTALPLPTIQASPKPTEVPVVKKTQAPIPKLSSKQKLQISALFKKAELLEKEGNIFSPKNNNAVENYKRILTIDPNNKRAKEKLSKLTQTK